MMEIEHVRPADIEQTSFRIIEKEIREMGLELPEDKKHVLLRVIHTTADFDYLDTMTFSKNAVEKAEDAFRRGAHVVTDTTMAMSGINKRRLALFGGQTHCYIADPEIAETARRDGTTRSAAAVKKALNPDAGKEIKAVWQRKQRYPLIFAVGNAPTALLALEEELRKGFRPELIIANPDAGKEIKAVWQRKQRYPLIFAVGNAPTALLALEEELRKGFRPELIIAVPVGFVNVVPAKERIMAACEEAGVPCICNKGRKGGSNVAAAICNAIMYKM